VARLLERANGLQIESTNLWRSNRIDISAQFGRTGTLPEQASIRSDRFRIPAEALELNNFEDLSGSLNFQWQRNQFTVDLAAAARPRPSVPMTPIDLQLRARGNTQTAFIETAKISAPWLVAELSPGVTISSAPPFLEREARVKVAVNLNRQPWIDAGGKL